MRDTIKVTSEQILSCPKRNKAPDLQKSMPENLKETKEFDMKRKPKLSRTKTKY